MKNSLNHLPTNKQQELQKIAQTISDNCNDIEKIILFGSYARGNYKEEKDLKPNRKSGHVSDYDILVITSQKDTALDVTMWRKISDLCKDLNTSASPRILTHDIEALNIKLAEGQYFFSDIKKEGVVIIDDGKFELADERNFTGKERGRIAQDHFDEWFESSYQFYENYKFNLEKGWNKKAAFNLHQAAESSYKAVLLVFSNYSPNEHFLEFLGNRAEKYHAQLKDIFTKITKEDKTRFKLLEYAYIGGRYDPQYQISQEDLNILAIHVKNLLNLSEKICQERITSFTS
jgi:uncharacterized protein